MAKKTYKFQITVPAAHADRLQEIADLHDMNISEFFRHVSIQWLWDNYEYQKRTFSEMSD